MRREEIVPRIERVRGTDASYDVFGDRALRVRWQLRTGMLRVEANLGELATSGFDERPDGRVLYATHAGAYAGGVAPPWSVRWSLA